MKLFKIILFIVPIVIHSCASHRIKSFPLTDTNDFQSELLTINKEGNLEVCLLHHVKPAYGCDPFGSGTIPTNDSYKVLELVGDKFVVKEEFKFNNDNSFYDIKSVSRTKDGHKMLFEGYNCYGDKGHTQIVISFMKGKISSTQVFSEKYEDYFNEESDYPNIGTPHVGAILQDGKYLYCGSVSNLLPFCHSGFFRTVDNNNSTSKKISKDCVATHVNHILEDNSYVYFIGARNVDSLLDTDFDVYVSAFSKDMDKQWEVVYGFDAPNDRVISSCILSGIGVALLIESDEKVDRIIILDNTGKKIFDVELQPGIKKQGCLVGGKDGELALIYTRGEAEESNIVFEKFDKHGLVIDELSISGSLDAKNGDYTKQDLIFDSKKGVYYFTGFQGDNQYLWIVDDKK